MSKTMEGLASWLLGRAAEYRNGSFIITAEKCERWASEVEAAQAALSSPAGAAARGDAQTADAYNGQEWELLAMALAADEHDDIHHLIWEGSPPEPWGEVWQRYEGDAQRMIALVRKHVPAVKEVEAGEVLRELVTALNEFATFPAAIMPALNRARALTRSTEQQENSND